MHTFFAAGVGFLVGVFSPAVCREVKSWFVAESKKLEAEAKAEVTKIEPSVKL